MSMENWLRFSILELLDGDSSTLTSLLAVDRKLQPARQKHPHVISSICVRPVVATQHRNIRQTSLGVLRRA